jgi:membrane-bound ClpP family serine protease
MTMILATIVLIVGCVIFLIAEILVLSGGLLGLASLACGVAAIATAFAVDPIFGWTTALCLPVFSLVGIRLGLRRLATSQIVAQSTIDEHAGYQHHAEESGIAVGVEGTLLTAARPTGRARFAGGIADVQVRGTVLEAGAVIRVVAIDGPTIFVTSHTPTPTTPEAP